MTRIVVDKTIHHAKPHSICFLPHYQRNLCLDNWKHRLGARAALCKWNYCTGQAFLSKTFANSLNMQKQFEKCLGKELWRVFVIDKSTYHEKPHFDLFFITQYQRPRKCFFQSASWKRHCVTHWREQRGRDSYLPRQISQSDFEITCNCGKINYWFML